MGEIFMQDKKDSELSQLEELNYRLLEFWEPTKAEEDSASEGPA